jgi:Spy/CpxP family protein refolding chaperone
MVAVVRASWAAVSTRRRTLAAIAVGLLVPVILVSSAMGQAIAPPAVGRPGPGEGRRLIETIKIWKMTEALKLTEDQAAKLFPKLTQLEASRREFHGRQRLLRDELAQLLRQRPLRDIEIKARLEELDPTEIDFKGRERSVMGELRAILSLEQQARLALFEERFEMELRRTIHDLRLRRQGFPPGTGPGFGPPQMRTRPPLPVEGGPPPR